MKLHLYTNNAYDTVALVKDGIVISHWEAAAPGGVHKTVIHDALHANDVSDWDDQGKNINLAEFEQGNDLYLSICQNGEWEVNDRSLTAARFEFLLGTGHPITKAFFA